MSCERFVLLMHKVGYASMLLRRLLNTEHSRSKKIWNFWDPWKRAVACHAAVCSHAQCAVPCCAVPCHHPMTCIHITRNRLCVPWGSELLVPRAVAPLRSPRIPGLYKT